MTDFQYTTVPGKLGDILSKIRSIGIPEKATTKWMKSIGFSSSNDNSLLAVLKFIDFCTSAGTPTDRWKNYRGNESKAILGLAIQHGYSDLFAVYPDAHNCPESDLMSFFSTRSTAGQQVISKTVSTFKALCSLAEFGSSKAAQAIGTETSSPLTSQSTNSRPKEEAGLRHNSPEVHIDIQIHISSDASAEQIDQIFSSMAKHLYGCNN